MTYELYLAMEDKHEQAVRRVEAMSPDNAMYELTSQRVRESLILLQAVRLEHTDFYLRRAGSPRNITQEK